MRDVSDFEMMMKIFKWSVALAIEQNSTREDVLQNHGPLRKFETPCPIVPSIRHGCAHFDGRGFVQELLLLRGSFA